MKAIRLHQFGGPEVLQIEDMESSPLNSGQVRIKTCGAGVNPIDWKTRQGGGAAQFLGEPPLVLGWECSGTVLETAADVEDLKVGDKVIGLLNFPQAGNCYAEEVVADADQLARCSETSDLLAAGGLPLAGLTAWQALFDGADTQANHRVLVLAAAGGVGHLVVQLAKWKGAWIAGTASSANHQYLEQLGCDQLIDYHQQQVCDEVSDIDVIIDCVGGQTAIDALSCLKPDGVLITLPSVTAAEVVASADQQGLTAEPIRVASDKQQLQQLATLFDEGKLNLQIERCFDYQQVAEAHLLSEGGHARGKIILIF